MGKKKANIALLFFQTTWMTKLNGDGLILD